MTTIVKTTSKGQITLPSKWRKSFDTDCFLIKEKADSLIITPLEMESLEDERWETVFDSKRDNAGKGVSIKTLIRTLRKTL